MTWKLGSGLSIAPAGRNVIAKGKQGSRLVTLVYLAGSELSAKVNKAKWVAVCIKRDRGLLYEQ